MSRLFREFNDPYLDKKLGFNNPRRPMIFFDSPDPPDPPDPPDYGQASKDAIQADIDTLAQRQDIIRAGRAKDIELLEPLERQAMIDAANASAPALLELQKKYGVQFAEEARKQLEASDPEAFKLRTGLGNQLLDEMALGGQLSPQQIKNAEQATRMAQAARGNIKGNAAIIQEAMNVFDVGEQMKAKRRADAQAFVFGQPLSAQFGNLQGAQQGAAPFSPLGYGHTSATLNPNAGAMGAQFAQGVYGTRAGIWGQQAQMAQQGNPWMNMGMGLLGTAIGGVTGGFL